jgi:hypothetical protein
MLDNFINLEELPSFEELLIFVFGSNLRGAHGKGAALVARQQYGAIYGQGVGLQGNSYAIPTKDERLFILPLPHIKGYVDEFIVFAKAHPEMRFQVTQIGCGHAKFTAKDIAPMFVDTPDNCLFDSAWTRFLPGKKFWGTYREIKPEIRRVKE